MEELVCKDTLQIESGLFSILDESETGGWENLEDATLLKYLHDGKAYTVCTHADGNFEIRVIKIEKRSDIYKLIEDGYDFIFKLEWAIIKIRTGKLLIADPTLFTYDDGKFKPIKLSVSAGSYWVMTGLVNHSRDFYGILVLLIPTEPPDLPDSYIETSNRSVKKIGEFD